MVIHISLHLKKIREEYNREDLYYMDMGKVLECWFGVCEIPEEIRKYINCLGDVALGEEGYHKEEISRVLSEIKKNYPNIYKKYHDLMVIAADRMGIQGGEI